MKHTNLRVALAVLFCASMAPAQVSGSGTKYIVPVWTGKTTLGNSAIVSVGGNVGIGITRAPGAKLEVENSSANTNAIIGSANATSGSASGVFGATSSPSGAGVLGFGAATSGINDGVTGITASSTNGANGVFGGATATTGGVFGVQGYSNSVNGFGVQGGSPNVGISGISQQCVNGSCTPTTGIGGLFNTASGGTILLGEANFTTVFRVDSSGKGFFDGGTQTGGADFAESMAVATGHDRQEPGDLLIVDTTAKRQLKLATEPYSTLVAGIYSTKPGVLATTHKMDEARANEIPLAIVGIVPCKVSAENGAIQPGDLLVTSSTPGRAMKGTDRSKMLGAVVGKALEPLTEGEGVIQVLVTLQ